MDPFKCLKEGDLEFFKTVDREVLRNTTAPDDFGDTLLKAAVRFGQLECCEEILKRCPELLYCRNNFGFTVLHQAALNKYTSDRFIKLLINAMDKDKFRGGESRGDDCLLTVATKNKKETALHLAVQNCHLQAAKLLIEADTQNKLLRLVDKDGDSVMHMAVEMQHLGLVKLLFEAGPNVEYSANNFGHTPLLIAFLEALTGDITAVAIRKLLIEKQPKQCKVRTGESLWTILHHAAYEGDLGTVKDIIRFCPDCLDLVDNEGQNFLHLAVKSQHANIVKYTVGITKLPAGVLNGQNNDGNTPLHIAALEGQTSMVLPLLNDSRVNKMVLNKGGQNALNMIQSTMDPFKCLKEGDLEFFKTVDRDVLRNTTAPDDFGDTLLKAAVRFGQLECCEEILKRCPELLYCRNNFGFTVLHQAALKKYTSDRFIKLLINAMDKDKFRGGESRGDDCLLTVATKNKKETALHLAVQNCHLQAAKLLIEADTQNKLLRLVDKDGDSAMHMAVKKQHLGLVRLLFEAGPNVEYSANDFGHTPLLIAFLEAHTGDITAVAIRKLLIEKQPQQCKVRTGESFWTILHLAVYKGDLGTVEDIIRFCPDCLDLVDNEGQNFLHLAAKFQHVNIVNYTVGITKLPAGVLNGQDNDGNTPLHVAALGGQPSTVLPLLYDSRVNKMVLNMQGQKALNMINFDYDKRKAGVLHLADRLSDKEIKEQIDFELVVCALIATVSFTAGITVPGGYISDGRNKGTAILATKITFKLFTMSNAIALLLSLYAVFSHFCTKRLYKKDDVTYQLTVATCCSLGAIFAMLVAFAMGSCAVLAITEEYAIALCVLCGCFFIFAIRAWWRMVTQHRPSPFQGSRCLGFCYATPTTEVEV